MNATSLGTAMRRVATIAILIVITPLAREPLRDSANLVDQATGKHAPILLQAQGRCFNGRCF